MCILRTQRKTSTSWYLKKMRSQHRNSNFTFSFSLVHSEYRNMTAKKYIDQEPPRCECNASNLCTAVGGDQNKEFRGNASFLREKGQRGGIRIYCYCIFHIDQKARNPMHSL